MHITGKGWSIGRDTGQYIALDPDTKWKRILERGAHHWKRVEHWKGQ